jgi:hypothetical protein
MRRAIICIFLFTTVVYGQNASVNVLVVDSSSQAPIANVEVKAGGKSGRTGVDGRARFENLPAGMFLVEAMREGYLDSKVTGSGFSVWLKDGTATEELRIPLARSTKIEGRVSGEDGLPMEGVIVHTAGGAEATTDKEGRFRLDNLRAGPCRMDFRVPADLRKKTLHRDAESGVLLGYPSVEFYPGVVDSQSAINIVIAAGMDLQGFEVILRRVHLVEFTGQILAHPNEPLSPAIVELQTPGDTPRLDEMLAAKPVDDDGRFRFELIPPGSYVLLIYRGEDAAGLPYILPVEIGKSGVRNRQILVPVFQTIRGILRVKDDAGWSGELLLALLADQKGVAARYFALRRSGEFFLEDLPPGEWQIGLLLGKPPVRASDNHQLTITDGHFGTTNPITGPIIVAEGGNPVLEIELSADTGRIAGRVTGATSGTVVLVERATAFRRYMDVPSARVNPDGIFVTGELAPGQYDIHTAGGKPVRVEVKAGETVQIELPARP